MALFCDENINTKYHKLSHHVCKPLTYKPKEKTCEIVKPCEPIKSCEPVIYDCVGKSIITITLRETDSINTTVNMFTFNLNLPILCNRQSCFRMKIKYANTACVLRTPLAANNYAGNRGCFYESEEIGDPVVNKIETDLKNNRNTFNIYATFPLQVPAFFKMIVQFEEK